MKRIINGKMYNTDTAQVIGTYYSIFNRTDFSYYQDTLYRKKTGEFFIHGFGGPLSKYAIQDIDGITGSEKITPMSEEQAKKWIEKYSDVDVYVNLFGCPEE